MKAYPASALPLVCYAALAAYAMYAALVVGHWPFYSHPDPKDLPAGQLTALFGVFTLVGVTSSVLIPFIYFIRRAAALSHNQQFQASFSSVLLFALGAAVWAVDFTLIHVGKHSLISWILD